MNLGFQELVIIFVIALLVFGPKRLPELGKSLGKGIRDFKKALGSDDASDSQNIQSTSTKDIPRIESHKAPTEV